jgi:hypothetical protein
MTPNLFDSLAPKSQEAQVGGQGGRHQWAKDGKGGRDLTSETQNWATPKHQDSHGGSGKNVQGGPSLTDQVKDKAWPTPRSRDWKGSGPTVIRKDGKSRMDQLDTAAEQSQLGPQGPQTLKDGPEYLPSDQTSPQPSPKRLLSSRFVEWLQGLPQGWVSLRPLATGSYQQWWQRFSEDNS